MPDIYLSPGAANPNDILLGEPSYSVAFYPGIAEWHNCIRNIVALRLTAGDDDTLLGGFFKPSTVVWLLPAERMAPSFRYRYDTPRDHAPHVFVPSGQQWTLESQRVPHARPWSCDEADVSWLASVSPVIGWNAPSDRMARRFSIWTPETNTDDAWLIALFGFDPAFFPGIAELVGQRTPQSLALAVAWQNFTYDLSWVHDVIPLTDPIPVTFIHLRPIAPIMNRRRQRRRR